MLPNNYTYSFTDCTKIDNFRANKIDSDFSLQTVDTTKTHGSKENPYVIANVQDWEKLVKLCGITEANSKGKYFVLANDIDFKDATFHPVGWFCGTFYGGGNTLKNTNVSTWQYYNNSSKTYVNTTTQTKAGFGTFCYTNNAIITDLNVDSYNLKDFPDIIDEDIYPNRGPFCGAIVGVMRGTTNYVLNCHTKGTISSNIAYTREMPVEAGIIGIVAKSSKATAYRCSSNITGTLKNTVYAGGTIGGITGYVSLEATSYIYDCAATVNCSISDLCTSGALDNHILAGVINGWDNGNSYVENVVGQVYLENVNNSFIGSGSISACSGATNGYVRAENGFVDCKVTIGGEVKYNFAASVTNGTIGTNVITRNIHGVIYQNKSGAAYGYNLYKDRKYAAYDTQYNSV